MTSVRVLLFLDLPRSNTMKKILCSASVLVFTLTVGGFSPVTQVKASEEKTEAQKPATKTTAKDRVCGMEVQKDKALKLEHNGKNYFFCSQQCVDTFNKEPAKYQKKENKNKENPEKK